MIKRILPVLLCLLVLLTTGGVYATWIYAQDPVMHKYTNIGVHLHEFEYPPEEILPGGDQSETEVELGRNHYVLIDIILNERDKSYGLNINDNVLLHQLLRRNSIVYANQKVQGGNLKFILDPSNNTHGLYYCLEKISDTVYYCYTYSVDDLATAAGTTHEILVYRTTLQKTDIWRATTSFLGYAKTKSLRELGESASSQSVEYAIDVTTWHHGE